MSAVFDWYIVHRIFSQTGTISSPVGEIANSFPTAYNDNNTILVILFKYIGVYYKISIKITSKYVLFYYVLPVLVDNNY